MALYELLLFVHVLAAATWFGAAVLSLALIEVAARAGERDFVVRLGHFDDALAKGLFIPAALLTLAAGIWLVFEGPWRFGDDGWVVAGLVLLVSVFVLGVGLIVPAGKRIAELGATSGQEAELAAAVDRLRVLSWIDVGLLVLAIFVMTVKPF
ncbi:MAG TPA: DUF2269 family protein [Gaiellaceae bacterium]|nr:DUF2269 family protein [Gaiellaceae bacterium]